MLKTTQNNNCDFKIMLIIARHCSKYLTNINSFNHSNNICKYGTCFMDEKTEAKRGYVLISHQEAVKLEYKQDSCVLN